MGVIVARIADLLQEGLALFGVGNDAAARECWEKVLEIDPKNSEARTFLDSLKTQGDGPGVEHSELWTRISEFVRDGKYEAAIELVEGSSVRLSAFEEKTVEHLRARLIYRYAKELGDLDAVPELQSDPSRLPSGLRRLARLVNGRSTLAEIVEQYPFDRLESYRQFTHLVRAGAVSLNSSASTRGTPVPPAPEHERKTHFPPPASLPEEALPPREANSDAEFEALFKEATLAYVRRDFGTARELFERCLEKRPGDARVIGNLEKLKKRITQ